MDKLGKLQVLLGEQIVGEDTHKWDPVPAKPQHLYEGTDSEDDEVITRRGAAVVGRPTQKPVFEPNPGKKIAIQIQDVAYAKLTRPCSCTIVNNDSIS
jgi:hypothetical protein